MIKKALLIVSVVSVFIGCGTTPRTGSLPQIQPGTASEDSRRPTYQFVIPAELDDPVGVGAVIEQNLAASGYDVSRVYISAGVPPQLPEPEYARPSLGSGFFVSPDGHILTNAHVVEGAETIDILAPDGESIPATVLAIDRANDIALIQTSIQTESWLGLNVEPSSPGDGIRVVGFPLTNILGSQPRVSEGIVSATQGIRGDPTRYQISSAIHSGNSGGPVVNARGEVIGIATEKLSDAFLIEHMGEVPQNINFAVKSLYAAQILPEDVRSIQSDFSGAELTDVIASTVLVQVNMRGMEQSDIDEQELAAPEVLVVFFRYSYSFDVIHYTLSYLQIQFVNMVTGEVVSQNQTRGMSFKGYQSITRDVVRPMIYRLR